MNIHLNSRKGYIVSSKGKAALAQKEGNGWVVTLFNKKRKVAKMEVKTKKDAVKIVDDHMKTK